MKEVSVVVYHASQEHGTQEHQTQELKQVDYFLQNLASIKRITK